MRFKKVKADEWQQPIKRRYKMVCCDCGLVHWTDFRIYRGRVQFRARRANGLTAKHRKDQKITFTWHVAGRRSGRRRTVKSKIEVKHLGPRQQFIGTNGLRQKLVSKRVAWQAINEKLQREGKP